MRSGLVLLLPLLALAFIAGVTSRAAGQPLLGPVLQGEAGQEPPVAVPQQEDSEGTPPTSQPRRSPKSREEIEQEMTRLKDLALSDADREQAVKFLQDALQATAELERLATERTQSVAEYTPKVDEDDPTGPQEFTPAWYETRLAMEVPFMKPPQVSHVETDPLPILTERASRLEGYANIWSENVRQLESAPATRKAWLNALPSRSLEIAQQLDAARQAIAKIDEEGASHPVTAARRMWLVQREARLLAEQAANEAKKLAIERADQVYPLELALARRKSEFYRNELAMIREGLSTRRQQEANQQAQVAQQELDAYGELIEKYPDTLGEAARETRQLTEQRRKLSVAIDKAIADRDTDHQNLQQIRSRFQTIQAEFEDEERLSQASGQVLRDERKRLPVIPRLQAEITRATTARNDIGFRRFEANDALESLKDIEGRVAQAVRKVAAADRPEVEEAARNMFLSQRDQLEGLERDLNHLESELASLIVTKKGLLDTATEFRNFIARRDLWIRSSRPLHHFNSAHYYGAFRWSFRAENWREAGDRLVDGVGQSPYRAIALGTLFLLLVVGQREGYRRLAMVGREATQKTCVEFFPTIRALWLTMLVALPWPLVLWSLGWLMDSPLAEEEFPRDLSVALRLGAWCLLFTEFLRHSCRPEGLADAHLNWSKGALAQMQRVFRWMPFTLIPLMIWSVVLDVQTIQPFWSASLGRALYIGAMLLVAVVTLRLLYVKSSPIYQSLQREPRSWLVRAHSMWRPLLLASPLALAIMAWIGYYYTAQQLTIRVLMSLALVIVLVVTGGLLKRWILLNRRKLAREQARQRRAQAIAAAEAAAAAADGEAIPPLVVPEYIDDVANLSALSEQSRKLLQMVLVFIGAVGAILIWQNIFPALAWLDGRALPWVAESVDNPTSWGDLLRALIACVVSYIVVRDVPGLLELLVLQHLPIDQGARYAIATLARYALLIVGVVVAANLLGITGTNISWLVAAMGVGLGFGLQEIFGNFVSGVILLFERPIRVGDVVTLGDRTGVVSRIRMRATTIIDGDRKEYIVPNKDLVTGRLLNWTLSDQTNRVTVNVGISYGSDTELACQLLREAAAECPMVLKEPPPVAIFEQFGPNRMVLSLRCFLPDMEKRGETMHRLHMLIEQKFRRAGLDMGIDQFDINLRSVPPLNWEQPGAPPAGSRSPSKPDGR